MRRELKFRAFDEYDQNWLYWDMTQEMDFSLINRDSISQFTGLKDKNGKEIYEGDILFDGQEKYICEFSNKFSYGAFQMEHIKWSWHFGGDSKMLEIVGNIFENPELLTVVKK